MPTWLISLLPGALKFFKHWSIYILLTVVLIGGPYLLYRHGHNVGYKAGYTQAIKDHPSYTVSSGGIVNNFYADAWNWFGFRFKFLFLDIKGGH
jgi:hypothetical protein